jgi:hypothetical protein
MAPVRWRLLVGIVGTSGWATATFGANEEVE